MPESRSAISETSQRTTAKRVVNFEPEAILPEQYFGVICGRSELEGERRLMLAILQDAIWCFLKYAEAKHSPGRKLFREAAQWIGDSCVQWMFSFESICAVLDLDANFLRQGLRRVQGDALGEQKLSPFIRVRLRGARRHQVVESRRRPKADRRSLRQAARPLAVMMCVLTGVLRAALLQGGAV